MRFLMFAALPLLLLTGCASVPEWKEILIVGDKITMHAPDAELGWQGDWGMAASAKDKDYVHCLEAMIRRDYPEVNFNIRIDSISARTQESTWSNNAELIIVQIGEEYKGGITPKEYGAAYLKMLRELRGDKETPVICVGPWSRLDLEKPIADAAAEAGVMYVSLKNVRGNPACGGYRYKLGSVPNDRGMKKIAETIHDAVKVLEKQEREKKNQ